MFLIVGLWNPGKEYANTRHNVGFMFVDKLATNDWKKWFQWVYSETKIEWKKVILLKPETYMNLSGKSVQACANFYKIPPENIIIISDDIDMEFGKIRYRESGSQGWHNGIGSIIEILRTPEIKRIKIGIGRHPNMAAADWVLSKFSKEEKTTLEEVFDEVEKKLIEKL